MKPSLIAASASFDEAGRDPAAVTKRRFFLFDRELIADIDDAEQERVIAAFEAFFSREVLPGSADTPARAAVERCATASGDSFVFRHNRRGGFVSHFVKSWFVRRGGRYRPVDEFRTLKRLAHAGCAVPRPLGVLVETRFGGMLYRGALATREIPAAVNFLTALRDGLPESEAARYANQAGQEAARALAEGVAHADLHLGNIIISSGERVYLLDWDKARPAHASSAARLAERFARSVHKHGRSELLVRSFCLGLEECR